MDTSLIQKRVQIITTQFVDLISFFLPHVVVDALMYSPLDIVLTCSDYTNTICFAGLNIPYKEAIQLQKPIRCIWDPQYKSHRFYECVSKSNNHTRSLYIATYLQTCFLRFPHLAARVCDMAICTLRLNPTLTCVDIGPLWKSNETLLKRLTYLRSTNAFQHLIQQVTTGHELEETRPTKKRKQSKRNKN